MNTVLNDLLIGWTDFPENQLLRCKKHKEYEAKLLLELPQNYAFLDIGAHYGDTVLTMAIHAKNNNRNDIRFYAFEPNPIKCDHIQKICLLNNLNVKVFNTCVGNTLGKASHDNVIHHNLSGGASYKLDDNGVINIINLNSIKDILLPIGIMHIDTEGWEATILKGASDILNNPNNHMYIIAEYWDNDIAEQQYNMGRGLGVSTKTPLNDIINVMKQYKFIRLDDINDSEQNVVYKFN